MKTTLEIPDAMLRRAKSAAAARGIPLGEFVTQALKEKLAAGAMPVDKPWLKLMGRLKHLHEETERINKFIEANSEEVEAELER